MSGITYYQHNHSERDIIAVFEHTEPYATAFGKPTFPAVYFEHTLMTFIEPRTFSPEGKSQCYHQVPREVATAYYPDHVRWMDLLIAAVQPPPLSALALPWPDIACPTFHLEGTGSTVHALLTLTSSAGQQFTTQVVESPLIALWRQLQDAILALQNERAALFIVDFGGDHSHLIRRNQRASKRPRLMCHRLPPLPFRLFPLVAHPWAVGGVCFDCREAYDRLMRHEQEGSAS